MSDGKLKRSIKVALDTTGEEKGPGEDGPHISPTRRKGGKKRLEDEINLLLWQGFLIPTPEFWTAYRAGKIANGTPIELTCELCQHAVETNLERIARQINQLGCSEDGNASRKAHCFNCGSKAQSEAAILQVIEKTRGISLSRRRFPLRIRREDYPEYFEGLKRDEVLLQLDGYEQDGPYAYEIQSNYHAQENTHFDSKRRQMADEIKSVEVTRQFPTKELVHIWTDDHGTVAKNLSSAKKQLIEKGVPIDPAEWDKHAAVVVIASNYRTDVITAVHSSGATWASTIPGLINQTTVLELICANGSPWRPRATQLVRSNQSGCSCAACGNRRKTSLSDMILTAASMGYRVASESAEFGSSDVIEIVCEICQTANSINVRTIRAWAAQISTNTDPDNQPSKCQNCSVKELIDDYTRLKDSQKNVQDTNGFKEISSRVTHYKKAYRRGDLSLELRDLLKSREKDIGGFPEKVRRSDSEKLALINGAREAGESINTNNPLVGEYVRHFRRQYRSGKLTPEAADAVRAAGVPIDSEPKRSPDDRLLELIEHIGEFGEMPTPTTNKSLNDWVRGTRYALRKNGQPAEFRSKWEAITRDVPNGKPRRSSRRET